MKKSVKKRVGKYGKSKLVHKSAKLFHLTFKVNDLTYLEAIEKSVLQNLTLVFSLILLVGTGFVLSGCPKIVMKQEENCLGMFLNEI